jgi:hypothetical protein
MTIGIFYICTGKYSIFWNTFYQSSEKYFVPSEEKQYFVFTDDDNIKPSSKVKVYHEHPKGFPLDSLLRFDMFLKIKNETSVCDYLFFFNSNMEFRKEVSPEKILPNDFENGLVAVLHPGYYNNRNHLMLPFEKHKCSTAYISYHKGEKYNYFMGGLNGGTHDAYYQLIQVCHDQIHEDLKNGFTAIYHDESHLNKYLHGKNIKILSPSYGYPEDGNLPFEPTIMILNKIKHGGKYFDKLPSKAYGKRIALKFKRIYWALIWKIGI